ncbi:uncharacterized protein GVI51_H04213 [Nakaseomyces glabratus]|uniref:Phosphatidylglycerophosphatase GEP4, mitochondrial n=2 Tax=Candida glabrata TaxID=5478 RepID=Q6FS08_CANGA|nr:uncharacterized protein CAGL0H04389g [Nakaseomyces glabratus]KAH7586175.1 Mitochondrial PGP phosphatase [Nakaseomyces glabratus]KAH7588334.1 Mitochondrial PGP phosphatase [Nakaseomyces glabratus]KAH7592147.1 Mitochondrial PGP phosphatase [Nakaseomyces glabratus]KAH7600792.1 Mitochondrial PGP phosphatase [Nakaseomyces glabratus]KAH7601412.1 Mitochondrial PGP phosphatase [Nakaseomyces glabratus]|eukprot:XP_446986.1 uncharacterized protein CAGL0H04389g [[Candida] glabrata]
MNFNATFNALRVIYNHSLCIPRLRIATFNQLPIPIKPHIKVVVVDKDNCMALQDDDKVWHEYTAKWEELKRVYQDRVLIVSNSAGSSDDKGYLQAKTLEKNTGVPVLRHKLKKPGCRDEIIEYFKERGLIEKPDEIAVIGDRLFTDILMANMMGSYGVWIEDGVKISNSAFSKLEKNLYTRWTKN